MTDYLSRQYDMDALAPLFDELTLWSARFGTVMLDHLELRPSIRALDLGCATGFPLLEVAEMHGPDSHFMGVDLWGAALHHARAKAVFHGLKQVDVVQADAANLPFPDRTIDLIVSNLGVNNFEHVDRVLSECRRVCRPGARIVLTTNPEGHMKEMYEILREELKGAAQLQRLASNEAHRGSRETLEKQLAAAGFRPHRAIDSSFALRFLNGRAMLRHHLVHWFLDGWRKVVEPHEEAELFARVEARLDRLAVGSGGLTMTVPVLYLEALRAD